MMIFTGYKGFFISLLFVGGLILCIYVLGWGLKETVQLLLPVLMILAYMAITVFVVAFLPCSFIKELRPRLSFYANVMAHVLGIATWMLSFIFVLKVLGGWAILLGFLFQFLAAVALVGAAIKGSWTIATHLGMWISFTYIMRFYSQWILNFNAPVQKKGKIIDVDAIEVH